MPDTPLGRWATALSFVVPLAALPAAAQVVYPSPSPPMMQPVPAPAPAAETMFIDGNGQSMEMQCERRDVVLRGNGNRVALRGGCRSLQVLGNANTVSIELVPAARVTIRGQQVQVFWSVPPGTPPPLVDAAGTNAVVQPIAMPAPPPPPPTGPAVTVAPGMPAPPPAAIPRRGPGVQIAIPGGSGAHIIVTETPRGKLVEVPGDVLFDFDRDELRPEAAAALDQLGQMIAQTRPRAIRVVGHTDSIGSDAYNLELSKRRASNVAGWLQLRAAGSLPMAVDGRGRAEPIAPNTTPDGRDDPMGRQRNRRVEVLLEN